MNLDDMLALLPDNTTGQISADDLRQIVTGLWDYTASVQSTLNEVVVTAVPAVQAAIDELDVRVTALENE